MLKLFIFLIAIFTAVISALIGIGGGLLLVPSLATLAQLPHIHAVGTALASMCLFSAVASYKNHRNNYIVWSAAAFIAAGSIAGAFLGAQISIRISLLTWKIGFILIALYLAYNMFYQKKNLPYP